MRTDEELFVGDKVDLLGHQNRLYRTMIEDATEERLFLVGVPRYGGVPMPIHLEDDVYMIFYRESGRYVCEMKVVKFENRGEVRYIWLYQKTEPVKNQRREAFRVQTILTVGVCEYEEDMEKNLPDFGTMGSINIETVSSRNISVTGIAIVSENNYKVGENYLLKLYLNWPQEGSPPFYTCAKIMRTLPWRDSGKSIIGLCYFGMTKDMNEFIAKYVLEEQRRQLKQRRLIKD